MSNIIQTGNIVRLRNVTRTFPLGDSTVHALDEVSLDLPHGKFIAVVGRSGSGKSTLVHVIAGIDRCTSGEVCVAGTRISDLGEDALAAWRGRHVGVVFQSFQLLPTLTIAENVALPIDLAGSLAPTAARRRALELLDRVGIADHADKLPSALSGGQQQRAAVARALANDPPILVADEPTGNLDVETSEQMLTMLANLARDGRTVLMVTHERDIARRVDWVVTLSDGRIASQHARETAEARYA